MTCLHSHFKDAPACSSCFELAKMKTKAWHLEAVKAELEKASKETAMTRANEAKVTDHTSLLLYAFFDARQNALRAVSTELALTRNAIKTLED